MEEALRVLRRDRAFGPLIRKVGTFELRSRRPYFWTLCRSILAQQVSGASARAISARVKALYPERRFPDPQSLLATPASQLRGIGVSRQKARYLRELAAAFANGGLKTVRFSSLSDDEVIGRLTAVPGVGKWTAEVFLLFAMRRPDIFPVDDLGIRRGMQMFFKTPAVPEMIERAERWQPYRSVASMYLWRGQRG